MSQFGLIPDAQEDEDLEAPRGHQDPKPRGRHSGRLAVIVSMVVLIGLGIAAATAGQSLLSKVSDTLSSGPEDYPGPGSGTAVIVVDEGDTATDIALTLVEHDVVASAEAFVEAAASDAAAGGIQPGTYQLTQQVPAVEALTVLVDPANRTVGSVLIREGLRVQQTIDAYVDQAGMKRKALNRAANQPKVIGLPPEAKGEPEGFLFPATYELEPSTTEAEALSAMTAKYAEVTGELNLKAGAKQLGMTKRQIVTVASIVQAEARQPEDFPKVARVIYNRLDDDEALAMDSTVAYANDVYTVFTTDEQRETDSPYNTYLYPGLPPGPINSPGEQALEAALNPADGDWRYFVTVDLETGEMKYAETLAEHEQNVSEAQANNYGQ